MSVAEQAVSVTVGRLKTADNTCGHLLEQEPWNVDVGKTSELQAILAMSAAIYGGSWPEVFCGGMDGLFNATVYVYPCDDTPFNLRVSHGMVSGQKVEILYRDEVIQTSLELEHLPKYPVRHMVRMAWLGNCYDNSGNIVAHPQGSFADGRVTLTKKVYGSLRLRYTVLRYAYNVAISKRFGALENKYQSVAYVVWDGGVKWLDIEAPANFEAFDGDCGNGAYYGPGYPPGYGPGDLSRTHTCDHGSHRLPRAVAADKEVTVDYCSQETTDVKITEHVDYEGIDEGCA